MSTDKLEGLKQLAQAAIDCTNKNPFTEKLGLIPAIQVYSLKPIASFPVRYKYLGTDPKGRHVYNLDAKEVVREVTRAQLEKQLTPQTKTRKVRVKSRR